MNSPFAINAGTLMRVPFPEDLAYYQEAGFREIEIWPDKIQPWLTREKRSVADARKTIADHGLQTIGACFAAITVDDKQQPWPAQQPPLSKQLDLVAELGAPMLALILLGARGPYETDFAALTDRCGWLADQAERRGLKISLEFLARIGLVNCLSSASRLITAVNRPNFGLLLDLYHFYLSESRLEDLTQLPRGKLFMGHLDDARPQPIEWLTHGDRTFPGEGVLPWQHWLAEIHERTGFAGPWSIELHSEWIWQLPPVETMARVRRAARPPAMSP